MGDEIVLKALKVIQGGKLQLDFYNETKKEHYRVFVEPAKFFSMLGESMSNNVLDQQIRDGWKPAGKNLTRRYHQLHEELHEICDQFKTIPVSQRPCAERHKMYRDKDALCGLCGDPLDWTDEDFKKKEQSQQDSVEYCEEREDDDGC